MHPGHKHVSVYNIRTFKHSYTRNWFYTIGYKVLHETLAKVKVPRPANLGYYNMVVEGEVASYHFLIFQLSIASQLVVN